jgi:TPR repeat protein
VLGTSCSNISDNEAVIPAKPQAKSVDAPAAPVQSAASKTSAVNIIKDVSNVPLSVDKLVSLAERHYSGLGVPQNIEKGLQYFVQAANAGSGYACRRMGMEYSDFALNDKTPRNYATARAWLEKGVALGDADSMFYLSDFLYNGRGGPVDKPRATKLLLNAAKSSSRGAAHRALKLSRTGALSISAEDTQAFKILDRNLQLNILAMD